MTAPHLSLPVPEDGAGLQVKHKQREVTYREREAQRVAYGEMTPHEQWSHILHGPLRGYQPPH